METYLIIILTTIVSAAGVFYSKSGSANSVTKVGYIILSLILVLGVLGGINAHQSKKSAEKREAELKRNFADAQHHLVLQWLRPAEKVDNFSFSASLQYGDREGFAHTGIPYATAGAIPFFKRSDEGKKVGNIKITIGEDVRRGFELYQKGDALEVHQAIGSGENAIRSKYTSILDGCIKPTTEDCKFVYLGGTVSWRESNDVFGSGFSIDLKNDVIAASIVTSMYKSGRIGRIEIVDAFKNAWWWERDTIIEFYSKNYEYEIGFQQKIGGVEEGSLCSYRYSANLKLELEKSDNPDDLIGYLVPNGPLKVGLCGLPY